MGCVERKAAGESRRQRGRAGERGRERERAGDSGSLLSGVPRASTHGKETLGVIGRDRKSWQHTPQPLTHLRRSSTIDALNAIERPPPLFVTFSPSPPGAPPGPAASRMAGCGRYTIGQHTCKQRAWER